MNESTWGRTCKGSDSHYTAVIEGRAVGIRRERRRVESKRRAGWKTYWYVAVEGYREGRWLGNPGAAIRPSASIAYDARVGFSTARAAKKYAALLVSGSIAIATATRPVVAGELVTTKDVQP